jgi:glycosyltransferase involved in cell wall biosynthesis
MNASISIIIPVYNGERFIRDALDSVCKQTLPPLEVVVADDVSTDNTVDMVKRYARTALVPIQVVKMEKNTGGPYGPASRAFTQTRGDFVAILDADDMFDTNAFATYMEMFDAPGSEDVGLATSDLRFFDESGFRQRTFFETLSDPEAGFLRQKSPNVMRIEASRAAKLLCSSFCLPFKGMLRRSAWHLLGGPDLRYVHVCDVDFVWRLATKTSLAIKVTSVPLTLVRMHSDSMSTNAIPLSRELAQLFRQMMRDISAPELQRIVRARLGRELFDAAYVAYKKPCFKTLLPSLVELACFRLSNALTLLPT